MNGITSLGLKFNKFLYFTIEGNRVPSGADLWGVALAAMYGIVQGGGIFGLAPTSFFVLQSKFILKEFWGIDGKTNAVKPSRAAGCETTTLVTFFRKQWWYFPSLGFTRAAKHDQVIGVLDWLLHEGHRADPQYVAGNPEAARDMLAWDLARAVMVARLALAAGYISDGETVAYIRAAATQAQQSFSSWEDYGRRYLKGLERWAGSPVKAYEHAVASLLKKPDSPWRQLDWRTRLVYPESENVEKGPLGILVHLRRARAGKAVMMAGVVATIIAILLGLQVGGRLSGPAGAHNAAAPKTADQEFSELNINFTRSASKTIAVLVTSTEAHPIADFRYGADSLIPDKTTSPSERENGRFPRSLYLPKETRFVTVQVRFDDGSLSPIRRFEVPSSVRSAN